MSPNIARWNCLGWEPLRQGLCTVTQDQTFNDTCASCIDFRSTGHTKYFVFPKNKNIVYIITAHVQSEEIWRQYKSIIQSTVYTQILSTVPVMSFTAVSSPVQSLIQDSALYFLNSLVSFNLEQLCLHLCLMLPHYWIRIMCVCDKNTTEMTPCPPQGIHTLVGTGHQFVTALVTFTLITRLKWHQPGLSTIKSSYN